LESFNHCCCVIKEHIIKEKQKLIINLNFVATRDLSDISQVSIALLTAFSSSTEEVKSVAAFSLGSVASGNLNHYLGTIMSEMKAKPKKEYLLLHSLKEMISYQASTAGGRQALQPHVPSIWHYLYEYRQCAEEGTRNVVAECLGKLTLIDPDTLMPHLRDSLNSDSAHMRTIAVTAIKFTISDQALNNWLLNMNPR
jgi:hypothetical protein